MAIGIIKESLVRHKNRLYIFSLFFKLRNGISQPLMNALSDETSLLSQRFFAE